MPRPRQFETWPVELDIPYGPYRAVIEKIEDGDTIFVIIDPGFSGYQFRPIRLAGVYAPEIRSSDPIEREEGAIARAYLESIAPVGTAVELHTDRDRRSFDRYIGWIDRADGRRVNNMMIEYLAAMGYNSGTT